MSLIEAPPLKEGLMKSVLKGLSLLIRKKEAQETELEHLLKEVVIKSHNSIMEGGYIAVETGQNQDLREGYVVLKGSNGRQFTVYEAVGYEDSNVMGKRTKNKPHDVLIWVTELDAPPDRDRRKISISTSRSNTGDPFPILNRENLFDATHINISDKGGESFSIIFYMLQRDNQARSEQIFEHDGRLEFCREIISATIDMGETMAGFSEAKRAEEEYRDIDAEYSVFWASERSQELPLLPN